MNLFNLKIWLLTSCFLPLKMLASDGSPGHIELDGSFELSQKSISTFKIESIKIETLEKNIFKISTGSLLVFGEQKGVYWVNGRTFELIAVSVFSQNGTHLKIKSTVLKTGDKIAAKGVPLLRIAHLQVSGQGVSGGH